MKEYRKGNSYKIGEQVKLLDGIILEVKKADSGNACRKCCFNKSIKLCNPFSCSGATRRDKQFVYYKKV